ncbi:Vps54-like protein-domain-containing protein [Hygrophoropsis aurantiaca]|uniref:Vps54-like protein-domain-containing protein n=1 Tax=Hygrophoropsis aurantiaca TaxID=72124 RepID=A0ACB8ABR8_9AGAM|nr:Vps54-like protein-domain-containing protein [Hygrophoropsis aurantiaca]
MSDYASSHSRPGSPVSDLPELPQVAPRPFRFQWDAASRARGPGSVSETTEGRGGDYLAAPLRIDVLNTSTTNLAPGALPPEWSSSKQGFYAISTVLNNPHKRQDPPKAHSALPSVPPAELPRVKRKDFDSYLRAISPEWERFERNMQVGRDGPAPLDGSVTPRTSTFDASQIPQTPRTGRLLTPLNSVPKIFFDPKFNLGDPRTFDTVTERQEGDDVFSDPSSLSYSQPLLEKLSHHADTIEQHLVREISIRSTSFFAALTNLQDLQTESEECLDRISKLRGLLKDVDEKGAKRGLEIVRKEGKLTNLGVVCEGTKEINTIVEMTGVAKGLVAAGQWGEALEIIEGVEALWESPPSQPPSIPATSQPQMPFSRKSNGRISPLPPTPESPPPEAENRGSRKSANLAIPLSSLHAFASLPSHLRTLTMEIASSLTTDLVNVLKMDLLDRVHGVSSSDANYNLTFKDRLKPLLQGLLQTKGLREATLSWREVVMNETRGTVKRHLSSFDLEEDDSKGSKGAPSGLASHLRSNNHADFISLLFAVYRSLLNSVEGLKTQNDMLIEVLEALQTRGSSIDISSLQEELSDILSSEADLANKLAAKLIGYRSEQHSQLDLPNFLVLFNESWGFVVKCEVICRRMIMGLRGAILGQAKSFLQAFHQTRINQSAKLVEDEQWNPMEVSPTLQHMADILADSAVHDSPDLVVKSTPSAELSTTLNGIRSQTSSPNPSKMNGSSASSSKYLRIEERPYYCVSATGEVLSLLLDYLKVVVNLPMLNTDTMSRIIEFLKAFNSRTCQVVLGAGAMRSAGLRNITAKHLALASQSLSIMVVLIPYVRETFRRHLSPNQAVMLVEFDKLKRDFQEHQNEIHSKLIAIMGDRISAHVKSLQAVNWEAPNQKQGSNDYMELLVKETVTLHKVLSRYLSAPVVEYVMSQVFAAINHRLSEEYTGIELLTQEAKDRLLVDARYLHEKLSVLKNVNAPTTMLETLVSEKPIPRKSALNTIRAAATPNERIKGLLSRKDSYKPDKPLPASIPSPLPSPSPYPREKGANGHTGEIHMVADANAIVPPPRSSSRVDFEQLEGIAETEGLKSLTASTKEDLSVSNGANSTNSPSVESSVLAVSISAPEETGDGDT